MAKRKTKKTAKKGVWQRLVRQELRQGDGLQKAIKDAKKRYSVYKKTGRIPKII